MRQQRMPRSGWLIAACGLGLGEMHTGGFYLAPFALGAALATVVSVLGVGLLLSTIVFLASSAAVFAALRPVARRHRQQGPADQFLVGAGRVPVGHVEEVDAEVERAPQDRDRLGLIEHPALPGGVPHRHGAEAKLRHREVCRPELDVIHARAGF